MGISARPNWQYVGSSFYIVRTQAGIKHAAIHFVGGPTEMEIKGYPQSYPALISLSVGYSGIEWIRLNAVNLNTVLDAIAESDRWVRE